MYRAITNHKKLPVKTFMNGMPDMYETTNQKHPEKTIPISTPPIPSKISFHIKPQKIKQLFKTCTKAHENRFPIKMDKLKWILL